MSAILILAGFVVGCAFSYVRRLRRRLRQLLDRRIARERRGASFPSARIRRRSR